MVAIAAKAPIVHQLNVLGSHNWQPIAASRINQVPGRVAMVNNNPTTAVNEVIAMMVHSCQVIMEQYTQH